MCSEVESSAAELRPELCPAVPRLLAELKAAGKLMGVTSGNVERIAWAKLKAAGIAHFFAFGSFSDRHESRPEIFHWGAQHAQLLRPAARVCFVGDTPADIAVATGIHSVQELSQSEPDLCIPACETLWSSAP
jgi:phosphoglycolate phosphatase